MRLDLLPSQPDVLEAEQAPQEASKEPSKAPVKDAPAELPTSGPGQINLGTLPFQPEPMPFREKVGGKAGELENLQGGTLTLGDIPELRAAPEEKGLELNIPESEVFTQQMKQFTGRMAKGLYGQEELDRLADTQKKIEFFMSRAPRIAMAFAAPLYAVAYEVLDQGKNLLVSSLKDEQYDPMERRILTELLPEDTHPAIKTGSALIEVLGDIALVGAAMNAAKQGTLMAIIKDMGKNLVKAGYKPGQVDIPKEAIQQAAKQTNLWKLAKEWARVRKIDFRAAPGRQLESGRAVSTTPMGRAVNITTPESLTLGMGAEAAPKVIEGPLFTGKAPLWFSQGAIAEKPSVGEAIYAVDKAQLDPTKLEKAHKVKAYFTYSGKVPKSAIIGKEVETEGEVSAAQKLFKSLRAAGVAVENVMFHTGADVGELKPDFGKETKAPAKPKPKEVKQFKKPTPAKLITSQSRYAELLGVKPFVEPMEIAKLGYDREVETAAREIDRMVRQLKKLKTVTTEEMAVALNKYENAPKEFGEKEAAIFNYFRDLTKHILDRTNEVRARMDVDPIVGVDAYFRHILTQDAKEMLEGLRPIPEKIQNWIDKNISTKIFNPMEKERQIEDKLLEFFSNDLAYVMKSMIRVGLREVYMREPKAFYEQMLKSVQKDPSIYEDLTAAEKLEFDKIEEMPEATKKWMEEYVRVVLNKQQTALDKSVNLWVTDSPVGTVIDKILGPFGKQLSKQPLTNFLSSVSHLPLYGLLGPFNPKQLIRNKFQLVQDLALYGIRATLQGFLPDKAFPALVKLKTDSLFLDTYSGIEGMPASVMGKLAKANFAAFQWTAVGNVSKAMSTAYHWTARLVQDPKNAKLGWADLKRTYKEPKDFFYPSELDILAKEMEYGAHTTQYSYLALGMPEAFRYKVGAPMTRLNSWWMNHWAVFHREAATRAFSGHTGYNSNLRVSMGQRMNYLKYLVIGGLVLNTLGYERSFLFGTAPTGVPPVAQFAFSAYKYFTTDGSTDWGKNQKKQAAKDMKSSAMTFIPGYLTIKDISALISGEKTWQEFLFYNKKGSSGGFKTS